MDIETDAHGKAILVTAAGLNNTVCSSLISSFPLGFDVLIIDSRNGLAMFE